MGEDYSKEYEWFAYYITATSVLIFIIVWSLLPEHNEIGALHGGLFQAILDILPQRRWVIYLQAIVLMGMLYLYMAVFYYSNDVLTPPLDDLNTVTDSQSRVAIVEDEQKFLRHYAFEETSALLDLPIMDVCEVLYSSK